MSTTAIIVNATDQLGKSAQKSVTNVNPAATNAQLVTLGQAINAISNNTYGGTVRIDKTDCDTEPTPAGLGKTATQVTITAGSHQIPEVSEAAEQLAASSIDIADITTNRPANSEVQYAVYVNAALISGYVDVDTVFVSIAPDNISQALSSDVQENGFDVTVVALETETYAAGSATYHVTFAS